MGKRQTFSKAFKTEAVRLLESGKKPAVEHVRRVDEDENDLPKARLEPGSSAN